MVNSLIYGLETEVWGTLVGCYRYGVTHEIPKNGRKIGWILRDGIASGRGVHRKMGVLIQKSRSNFRGKSGKSRFFEILGVGVV